MCFTWSQSNIYFFLLFFSCSPVSFFHELWFSLWLIFFFFFFCVIMHQSHKYIIFLWAFWDWTAPRCSRYLFFSLFLIWQIITKNFLNHKKIDAWSDDAVESLGGNGCDLFNFVTFISHFDIVQNNTSLENISFLQLRLSFMM